MNNLGLMNRYEQSLLVFLEILNWHLELVLALARLLKKITFTIKRNKNHYTKVNTVTLLKLKYCLIIQISIIV